MLRIPKTITLPFGYRVSVKQVSDAEMNEHSPEVDALWNVETRTILIRKRLSAKRRAYLLTHEVGHAFLDWQHQHLDTEEVKP